MNDNEAAKLLKRHGLDHGMVDAQYEPARWMVEAVKEAATAIQPMPSSLTVVVYFEGDPGDRLYNIDPVESFFETYNIIKAKDQKDFISRIGYQISSINDDTADYSKDCSVSIFTEGKFGH